ncbi:MAG: hypothetical protein KAQ96_07620 [Thermoplasmata archaeon]|nr:hypothetical protein [Thermoplasmata archaeon]
MVNKDNMENSALAGNVSKHTTATSLMDPIINIKLKLAIFWVVLIFFYLYNDVISFMRKDIVEGVLSGTPGGIEITPVFLVAGAVLMSIPIFMVLLSVVLPARTNRPVNIIVGIFHLVLLAFTTTLGDEAAWAHYALYMVFEGMIIVLITWYAWKWPTQEGVAAKAPSMSGYQGYQVQHEQA